MASKVTISIGGQDRALKVTIGLAPDIEEATGKGVLTLARALHDSTCKLTDAAQIIRVALAANGVHWDNKQLWERVDKTGVVGTITAAALIIRELFAVPEEAKKPGNAKAAAEAATN